VQDIYLSQTGKTHRFYFQNWTGTNANFQNANNLETPVVFTLDGATAQANLKGTQLSNNSNAFANNSQRKLIKTPDGLMHLTYESMGRIFYETSTDNGTTWQLMNGGKPLDNGAGKCPTIDYSFNRVAIVYQQKNGDYSTLQLKSFIASGNQYIYNFSTTLATPTGLYSSDANPAFAWSSSDKMIVVWQNSSSLSYLSAILGVNSYSSSYTYIDGGTVNSTNSLSKFPSISTDKYSLGGRLKYQIAWQQSYSNGQSAIYYCPITLIHGTPPIPPIPPLVSYQSTTVQPLALAEWYSVQSTPQNLSTGSYPYNYKPSVIALPDSTARFCWIGQYYLGSSDVRVAFKSSNNTRYWYFGNNVRSTQITLADDNSGYYIIWNEINDNSIKFTDNTTLSNIYNLNTTGKAVQLSNGANKNNMYALVFNNQTQPYFFKTSPSIGSMYGLQKSILASNPIVGRGGVVLKDSVGFYFSVENISIDNQPVDFVEISDTKTLNNSDQLNEYLLSQPFTLSGNWGLNFAIAYGTTSTNENKILENKNTVSYSLDLIDANSSQVLTNIKKIVFDKNNLPSIEAQAFQLSSGKLTSSKTVQLKLTVQNNFDGQCLLTKSYSDIKSDVLAKSNTIEINDENISNIKDYVLWQNNPNPFNPSTKISWQSPVGSHQTLKIYDILGNEVATLVDEYREAGRYEINFDASNPDGSGQALASGVYIYRIAIHSDKIQAGSFVNSKKMILLK